MAKKVDLNADMGESYGRWTLGNDDALMPHLTSANIACGFHGGDPHVMRRTVALAVEHGIGMGAHVGFPDLIGFGRRRLAASPEEIRDYVLYQAGALRAFAEAAGGGGELELEVESICVHGDAPNALEIAGAIRRRLEESGVELVSLAELHVRIAAG